jgi:hypothetical protein
METIRADIMAIAANNFFMCLFFESWLQICPWSNLRQPFHRNSAVEMDKRPDSMDDLPGVWQLIDF